MPSNKRETKEKREAEGRKWKKGFLGGATYQMNYEIRWKVAACF
jgi:hypothetical protein